MVSASHDSQEETKMPETIQTSTKMTHQLVGYGHCEPQTLPSGRVWAPFGDDGRYAISACGNSYPLDMVGEHGQVTCKRCAKAKVAA